MYWRGLLDVRPPNVASLLRYKLTGGLGRVGKPGAAPPPESSTC